MLAAHAQVIADGSAMSWFVYLLECRNGAIYTGITTDVEARFAAHLAGKGARYTRANPPVRVLASLVYTDRSAASKAECAIKRLTPAQNRSLCQMAEAGVASLPFLTAR